MSVMIALRGIIITPTKVLSGGYVLIRGDTIEDVVPTLGAHHARYTVIEEHAGDFILAGFVDIHNHGTVGGEDVLEHWMYPEENLRHFARTGTTSVLASIIFSSKNEVLVDKVIEEVERTTGKVLPDCAILEGIHAEGPIIADYGGLPQAPEMPLHEFTRLCSRMASMRVMTISPSKETPVKYARLKHLLEIGVRPSLGHDRRADENDVLGALQLAAKYNVQLHSTHMYNVMAFHHTKVSLANFLLCPRYPAIARYTGCVPPTIEMIADNIHVHPLAATAVIAARDLQRDVCVITDCLALPTPGIRLKYMGREAIVRAEGAAYLCDQNGNATNTLAGSTATLGEMLHVLVTQYRVGIIDASRMVSATPAVIANLPRVGSLEKGKYANLVCISPTLDVIERVMVRGVWVKTDKCRILKSATHSNL
jgi:N-acetylglucosamine-6-phosphate deacetylase